MDPRSFRSSTIARSADDCEQPVCEDAKDFSSVAKMFKSHETPCPLKKDQLGRNTWSFLHTMAAHYPDKPSKEDQKSMVEFIKSFGQFYPCKECARDFRDDVKYFPPSEHVFNRIALSQYFCMLHNRVSTKLGRENEFDCSIESLDRRWKYNPDCK